MQALTAAFARGIEPRPDPRPIARRGCPAPVASLVRNNAGRRGRAGRRHQLDVASRQRLPVGVAQDGYQHLAAQAGIVRLPIDVEEAGELALGAVGQHVAPPRIVGRIRRHVIGHDVRDQAQPARAACQRGQGRIPAEFVTHAGVVRDVVAVRRAAVRRTPATGRDGSRRGAA